MFQHSLATTWCTLHNIIKLFAKLGQLASDMKVACRHNLAMAIATASVGLETAAYIRDDGSGLGHASAIEHIRAEILLLLQHATVYSMAAMLRDVLQRYYFMLRGLMSPPSKQCLCTPAGQLRSISTDVAAMHIAPTGCWGRFTRANNQIGTSAKAPALPSSHKLVHEASSLRPWHDGLEELAPILVPCSMAVDATGSALRISATPLLESINLLTIADWEWYIEMMRLPSNINIHKKMPPSHIPVSSLLELLGAGPTVIPAVQAGLCQEHESVLRQAVLPSFIDRVIGCLDDQGLDLNLKAQHAKTPFLQGSTIEVRNSGAELQLTYT